MKMVCMVHLIVPSTQPLTTSPPHLLLLLLTLLSPSHSASLRGPHFPTSSSSSSSSALLQPIASRSQSARVCAELCAAGLGGEPCGPGCADLAPQALPLQSPAGASDATGYDFAVLGPNGTQRTPHVMGARRDSCDVLCANGLGYPLCGCEYSAGAAYVADFVEVCSHFCVKHDYRIFGCQNCSLYQATADFWPNGLRSYNLDTRAANVEVNWDAWCDEMCAQGDGGAACNCDLLPMMADPSLVN